MKVFTKREIEAARRTFAKIGKTAVAEVSGRRIDYYVLPSHMNPELNGFVYRATGSSDDYLIGVDERMAEDLRPYAVLQEYIEFVELGSGPGSTLRAEKEALEAVPADIKPVYMSYRLGFFRHLLHLSEKDPEEYMFTPEDRKGFEDVVKFLEQLIQP